MNDEMKLFQGYQVQWDALRSYGFVQTQDAYVYRRDMQTQGMRMEWTITLDGTLSGRVIDTAFMEEYINFRMEHCGTYGAGIREEYLAALLALRDACFIKTSFRSAQANRLEQRIAALYHDAPAFLWDSTPDAGVFRHRGSEKWYAIIMHVAGSKVQSTAASLDIINVKVNEHESSTLWQEKGFAPAYHMNKKHWITIYLDDTLSDDQIMRYVEASYRASKQRNEWILPANPKVFDVIAAFQESDTLTWKQGSQMQVGHRVYIYYGAPYSALLFQCRIVETDIQAEGEPRRMRIQYVARFEPERYPFALLKQYGVNSVRSIRSMPESLCLFIHENETKVSRPK